MADRPNPTGSEIDAGHFDASVRPQDDLFLHVNGGWIARTQIPPDKASYGAFAELYDRTQAQLKNLVTSIPADTRDADA
ncbi:MAG: peptidase M13, partial [Gammaproteobacteria bacterium]|nr:peptidase M13 [Gammaproteobacteria bacterium]